MLAQLDQSTLAPARGCQPRQWMLDRHMIVWSPVGRSVAQGRDLPPVEPKAGAHGVDSFGSEQVLAKVQENVDEPVAHLAWRAESARMIAIAPHPSPAPANLVDATSETNREPGHSTRAGYAVVRFDDEVDVILLDGKMNHTKPRARRLRQGAANAEKHRLLSQAGQTTCSTHRDMQRLTLTVQGPCSMRYADATRARFAIALAAPSS